MNKSSANISSKRTLQCRVKLKTKERERKEGGEKKERGREGRSEREEKRERKEDCRINGN